MTQWDEWLSDLRAARKGGLRFTSLTIVRGLAWSKALRFAADYSLDAFTCNLAAGVDGTVLVSPSVSVGGYSGGYTTVTLSLTAVQTADAAKIPADGDADGVVDLTFDLLHTPSGGAQGRLMAGLIPVSGKV